MLLAGTGERTVGGKVNWLVVNNDTTPGTIRDHFKEFSERDDIAIILINQHIANIIRSDLVAYKGTVPTVLEIPSKAHPYDPSKDQVLKQGKLPGFFMRVFPSAYTNPRRDHKVNMLLGGE